MSSRQLIFVGCKILGMYLVIVGLGYIPYMISYWQDMARAGKDFQEMFFSTTFGYTFGAAFDLLAGLVLFFRTEWISKLISVSDSDVSLPTGSAAMTWGIVLVASIYVFLLDFPTVLLGSGVWLTHQISGQYQLGEFSWHKMVSNELPVKFVSCVVALLFSYVSLRATYGNEPFRWWNGEGDFKGEE